MRVRCIWQIIIFLTFGQDFIGQLLSVPTCLPSQKLRTDNNRKPICCYTTSCNKNQQFEFCISDQGYDVCRDCPQGSYTDISRNTEDWDFKPDVCVTLPHCNADEIMVGNTCQCALGQGYYGNRDNCILDTSCKLGGFQLQNDGSCVACDSDHFKPENGTHGICRNKTRCKYDEKEINSGTTTTDRTCIKVQSNTTGDYNNKPVETMNQSFVISITIVTILVSIMMTGFICICIRCCRLTGDRQVDTPELVNLIDVDNKQTEDRTKNAIIINPDQSVVYDSTVSYAITDKDMTDGMESRLVQRNLQTVEGSSANVIPYIQMSMLTNACNDLMTARDTNSFQTLHETASGSIDKTSQLERDEFLLFDDNSVFETSYNLTNKWSGSCKTEENADSSTQQTGNLYSESLITREGETPHEGTFTLDIAHISEDNEFMTPESNNEATRLKNVLIQKEGKTPNEDTFRTGEDKELNPVDFEVTDIPQKKNIPTLSGIRQDLSDKEYLYTLLKDGSYECFWNRIYLAGPSNVGKTTLACCLLGKDIPTKWYSANGLETFFGHNGIDLNLKKMIPIAKDAASYALYQYVIEAFEKRSDLQRDKEVTLAQRDGQNIHILPTSTGDELGCIFDKKKTSNLSQIPDLSRHTLEEDTLHQMVLNELKRGLYKNPVAYSTLVDFGGQKTHDPFHHLFILQNGSVLLMFDGRKNLQDRLTEYSQEVTTASILIHWVNSILAFCPHQKDEMPQIQFVATHSDYFRESLEKRRRELQNQIRKIFRRYKKRDHLYYDPLFFINAIDSADKEVERLKDQLVKFALLQPSWGIKMPLSWVPLEHQIMEMKHNGKLILTMDEILTLNSKNESFAMNEENLTMFLRVQHAMGKILFFPEDDFVITDPTILSNVTGKFITEKLFCEPIYHNILLGLHEDGVIKKKDLESILKQSFSFPTEYIDYLLKILLCLDFLVEPLQNPEVSDYFIVPCMVQTRLNNNFANKYLTTDKSICMSYVLSTDCIPPALFLRLAAAAASLWPLTKYMGRDMIFKDFAVFTVEDLNNVCITFDKNRIIVYFTNMEAITEISPDYVSSVKEFLTCSLDSKIQFYQNYGSLNKCDEKEEKLYELEFGVTCQKDPCFIQVEELMLLKSKTWKCKHGQCHNVVYLWYWDNFKRRDQSSRFQQINYHSDIMMTTETPLDLQKKVAFAVGTEGGRLGLSLDLNTTVVEKYLRKKGLNMFQKNFRILKYWELMAAEKATVEHLINAMVQIGGRGLDTVERYYRKNKPLEWISDENLLRVSYFSFRYVGLLQMLMSKKQRSNSICAAGFNIELVEKEWFYKLKIKCDEKYELHVINDLRLQMKYETLKSETQQKEYRNFRAKTECQGTKSIEEFEMIYKQMKIPQFRLEHCIQPERNLLFRFMLARITPSILIVDNLKIAMENRLPRLSMAISWYLVRHYVAQSQVKNLLGMTVDIWPGFYCKCLEKGHSSICSTEPVIVVEAERHLDALPKEYLGIQVLQSVSFRESQSMEAHESAETEHISHTTSHSQTIQELPCNIVENLFLKHSKLTMTYISSDMPEYVQLCCQVKGVIPIGEDHFPAEVYNLKAYVREGHVLFLQNLFVGQRISKEASFSSYGTLGGFVKYRGKPAALTCAHVLYDRETLLRGSKRDKHETEVDTFCRLENGTAVASGYVVHDAFEYDTKDKTSVDAAVVRLKTDILVDENAIFKDNTSTANPVSHLGMTSPFLNDNYITHRIITGTMTARYVGGTTGYFEGQITYEDYDADDEIFNKTKLEHGVVPQWENLEEHIEKIKAEAPKPMYTPSDVYFQKTIVPTLGKNIQHKRYFVRFYNQLLLDNFPCHPGDSGSCIYVIEDKTTKRSDLRANPTGCLGMVIANYIDVRDDKTKCIVTPMKAILKELGLI